MKNLFICANNLPVDIERKANGFKLIPRDKVIRSGLVSFYKEYNSKWIGQLSNDELLFEPLEMESISKSLEKINCIPVNVDIPENIDVHQSFSKNTIWPLFHYYPQHAIFNTDDWETYKNINRQYADKLIPLLNDNDLVWIHDYHLLLLPQLIREQKPNASISLFLHIPFPSFEMFRLLPQRLELLTGMLASDLIGFHTYDYVRHFLKCVQMVFGYDTMFNRIQIEDRTLKVDAFPKGVDFKRLQDTKSGEHIIKKEIEKAKITGNNKQLIVSIDRLEYTKGIKQRLLAFDMFLKSYPQYCKNVSMILVSGEPVEATSDYERLQKEVFEIVGRINGDFGNISWIPIRYLNHELPIDDLIDLYNAADVALITPMRDGMNMVAKEYVVSKKNGEGVLILSEMAGAAKELHEALIVNPNNRKEMVFAIKEALEMPVVERKRRIKVMQDRLNRYNIARWAREFIKNLESVKELQEKRYTRKINIDKLDLVVNTYKKAKSRIIFLDYDGTLTGFYKDPEDAKPNEELYKLLKGLISDKKNTVVIISGRDKDTLNRWFDDSWRLHFIAEHGVWLKEPNCEWQMFEQIDNDWKKTIRPFIEYYVDITPRSFIEDKNFSLVWHYRNTDTDLGQQRAWELKDELLTLTSNLNLEIMDGDKVLEIKYSGINKGRAALSKIGDKEYDFIAAFGDDWTDEYTFDALPEDAYTIKVGTKTTKARFYVESVEQVRKILAEVQK